MGILANKVNRKVLDEVGFEEIRLTFYGYMTQLAHNARDALALAKHAQAVLATRGLGDNPEKWRPVFESLILSLALAPRTNESSDMLARIKVDPRLEEVGAPFQSLVVWFTTAELIPWPLKPHDSALTSHSFFSLNLNAIGGGAATHNTAAASTTATTTTTSSSLRVPQHLRSSLLLVEDEPKNPHWLAVLEKRVLQHNIRVLAGVYSHATLTRLCALSSVSPPTLEAQLSELVANGSVAAKIDRPGGVVQFGVKRQPTEVLSDWASDVDSCLGKLEMVVHLVRKEEQMAKALKAYTTSTTSATG